VIVLDASVMIAHLDARDPHHQPAVELLRAHAMEVLGASQISLAETLVAPARAGRLEDAREALEKLSVHELAFGHDASPRLAGLRAETGLKMPDCCVLLTAGDHRGGVASFDRVLCRHARDLSIPVVD
jgi:predicted nucleic acid-binding protein